MGSDTIDTMSGVHDEPCGIIEDEEEFEMDSTVSSIAKSSNIDGGSATRDEEMNGKDEGSESSCYGNNGVEDEEEMDEHEEEDEDEEDEDEDEEDEDEEEEDEDEDEEDDEDKMVVTDDDDEDFVSDHASASGPKKRKAPVVKKEPASSTCHHSLDDPSKRPAKISKIAKTRNTSSKVDKVKLEPAKPNTATRKVPSKPVPPLKMLEMAMRAHKWWEDPIQVGENKWSSLEHNGVMFPPPYEAHGTKLLYDDKEVDLSPEEEEIATLYAEVPLDGPQLGNPKTAKVFNANFFKDFRDNLRAENKKLIRLFSKCDFSRIRDWVNVRRQNKKDMSKEEKAVLKAKADESRMIYSFAVVDGHLQKVGNVMVEPPGLFRGRGDHPKTGMLKKRVMPEQITINVGPTSPVPPCPVPGHSWGRVVHKKDVTWLAYWKENVMGGTKYVWLAASSGFKGQADMAKYEKARELRKRIGIIRADYEKKLSSKDRFTAQLGTAMWVIDRLALRVGNEKDDDEADTVGCCSLRVEHITVDPVEETLTLDFLGKDSMRHFQVYPVVKQYGAAGSKVLKNFQSFTTGKKPGDDLFEQFDAMALNEHLKTLMAGLSAKVFRTMNASFTLQSQLENNQSIDVFLTDQEKLKIFNDANREVAILCNHQRTVSGAAQGSIEKLAANVELLKEQLNELKAMLKRKSKGKDIKLKPELTESATKDEKKAIAHLFSRQPSADSIEKRIVNWRKKIKTQQLQHKIKDENKSVALGTSKINYIDPRITVAFCKRYEVPIERVFPAALRDKFSWAMGVSSAFSW